MKKILLLSLMCVLLASCKKKENEEPEIGVTYFVAVNVNDNVNYSTIFNGGNDNFNTPIDPSKNASKIINHYLKYGDTTTLIAETVVNNKGNVIEVIVTNSETGEVMFSDKKIDKVTATWTAKK